MNMEMFNNLHLSDENELTQLQARLSNEIRIKEDLEQRMALAKENRDTLATAAFELLLEAALKRIAELKLKLDERYRRLANSAFAKPDVDYFHAREKYTDFYETTARQTEAEVIVDTEEGALAIGRFVLDLPAYEEEPDVDFVTDGEQGYFLNEATIPLDMWVPMMEAHFYNSEAPEPPVGPSGSEAPSD
jgi:hypothetical protein